MRWYRDLKLAGKLVLGFVVVAAMVGVVGWFGYSQIRKVNDGTAQLYEKNTLGVLYAGQINGSFRAQRGFLFEALTARTEAARREALKGLAEREAEVMAAMQKYPETFIDDGDKAQFQALQAKYLAYSALRARAVEALETGQLDRASAILHGDLMPPLLAARDEVHKLMDLNAEAAAKSAKANDQLAANVATYMLVFTAAGVALATVLGLLLGRSLGNDLRELVSAAKRIAAGDLQINVALAGRKDELGELAEAFSAMIGSIQAVAHDTKALSVAALEGRLSVRADASKHGGEFREIVQGFNDAVERIVTPFLTVADYLERISHGELPPRRVGEVPGEYMAMRASLNRCLDTIGGLVGDTDRLAQAAIEGNLSARADVSKHEGAFKKTLEGVNRTLDAVISPLNVAADYVDRISKGYIPA
ncbi:MAG TPA: MCP four helix bundle domain-containing protein, partial [Anaeromyxobacteraceae bacterium]|nr:MCP four helix bundle domain-containing protein [Anaeromyxobacteraceae bacterium]